MRLLYQFEQTCIKLRHSRLLSRTAPLWAIVRPAYDALIRRAGGSKGLLRNINGTDQIRILSEFRSLHETYEPDVWKLVMAQVGAGSRVIDVGAHIGLYALAFGRRVGREGRVLAVEPDPENLISLRRHIALNGLQEIVTVLPAGLSEAEGEAPLETNDMQSHVSPGRSGSVVIKLRTLDQVVGGAPWDLMLIDVEGHEEMVLRGGRQWLSDATCRPDMILIEVHPYAWPELGTSSESLMQFLRGHGYSVESLAGEPVDDIKCYGHVVARQHHE